jgi:hypothetical protein
MLQDDARFAELTKACLLQGEGVTHEVARDLTEHQRTEEALDEVRRSRARAHRSRPA